jgi:hypothetical protein
MWRIYSSRGYQYIEDLKLSRIPECGGTVTVEHTRILRIYSSSGLQTVEDF